MSEYKSKAAALRALLKNKETARQIFDAVRAPHGSTKQKTATRLLRSVGKISDNKFNDGQGGVGPLPAAPRLPMAGARTPQAAPAPRLPMAGLRLPAATTPQEPQAPEPTYAIAHGIDDLVPKLMMNSARTPAQASSSAVSTEPTKPPATPRPPFDFSLAPKTAYAAEVGRNGAYSQGEVDQMFLQCVRGGGKAMACAMKGKDSTGMMVSLETARAWAHRPTGLESAAGKDVSVSGEASGQVFMGPPPALSDNASSAVFIDAKTSGKTKTDSATGSQQTGSASGTGEVSGSGAPGGSTSTKDSTTTGASTEITTGGPPPTDGSGDDIGDIFYSTGTTDIMRLWGEAVNGLSGDAAVDAWMVELKKRDLAMYDKFLPIYNAYKSRGGAGLAALDIMTDPDQLATSIGIPKEVLDKMPWDIFGGPKLLELRAAARKSANLDQLEAELKDRQTSHLYADTIFKNYVLEKDGYLNKVDTMIHEYDDYLRTADRSDPRTRRMMQNYRNYLVTLKGATQQKYINIINDSLKLESADYQRFYTMYQTAAAEGKAMENALISQASNSWKTMVPMITKVIENQYDYLSKLSTASLDSFKLKAEALTSAAKAAKELANVASNDTETLINPDGSKVVTKTSTVNGVENKRVINIDPQGNVISDIPSTKVTGVTKDHGPKTVTSFEGEHNEITVKTTTTIAGGVPKVDIKKFNQQGELIYSTTGTADPVTGEISTVNVYKKMSDAAVNKIIYTTVPGKDSPNGVLGTFTLGGLYEAAKAENADPKAFVKAYMRGLQRNLGTSVAAGDFSTLSATMASLSNMDGVPPEDAEQLQSDVNTLIVATVPVAIVEYLKTEGPKSRLPAVLKDLGGGGGGFDWGNFAKGVLLEPLTGPWTAKSWFKGKGSATRESFIDKHKGSIAPEVLGLLWDGNASPQAWLNTEEAVQASPGFPFTWTEDEWNSLMADEGKLMSVILDGSTNFLVSNPGYKF